MFLTQRQIYHGVFLLLIAGAILGSLVYILRGDNPTALTIILTFIPFASGCLWAYRHGWEQARYAMALLITILAPLSLTEPFITGQFSLVLFVAPSLALLLTNSAWAFGSAVACVLVTLARAGWQGAHADPVSLLLYSMVIGAITISRIAADSALRLQSQAQQVLRANEARGRALLNAIPDLMFRIDQQGTVIDYNAPGEALLFMAPSAFLHRPIIKVLPPDLAQRVGQAIAQAHQTHSLQMFEYAWATPMAGDHTSEARIVAAENGETIIISRDITERKRAEAEREALIGELEAKNTELERFTYTVSHDLKSPLITIRGFLGYIEQDARAGNFARLQSDIARIASAASKMQQLLDELLALSRIGRLMRPPQLLAFADLAHEALSLVAGQISAHHVGVALAPDLPLVYGDRMRLIELLQNLLDNAIKFMGSQPQPRIAIGHRPADIPSLVTLTVRDNGIGIDPAYHEQVFGLFDKLDPQSMGTGVGLALAKRIVEVHGGKIWIESNDGQAGATFCFTLPSALVAAAYEEPNQ